MQKEGHIRENVRMPVENEWELCSRFEDGKGRAVAVVMIDAESLKLRSDAWKNGGYWKQIKNLQKFIN